MKYKEGDIVKHITGKRKMVVTDANQHEDDIIVAIYDCRWESGDDFSYGSFVEYELELFNTEHLRRALDEYIQRLRGVVSSASASKIINKQ